MCSLEVVLGGRGGVKEGGGYGKLAHLLLQVHEGPGRLLRQEPPGVCAPAYQGVFFGSCPGVEGRWGGGGGGLLKTGTSPTPST